MSAWRKRYASSRPGRAASRSLRARLQQSARRRRSGRRQARARRSAERTKCLPATAAHSSTHAFLGRQPVETRGDERLDRRRNRIRRAALRQHRGHLLEVERIPLGRLRDPSTRGRVERPLLSDLVEECVRLLLGQRLEQSRRRRVASASPDARRADPVVRGRAGGPVRRASSRRGTRAGRAASARPSGCPRRARRAAARARPPRAGDAPPRTSRRRSCDAIGPTTPRTRAATSSPSSACRERRRGRPRRCRARRRSRPAARR